MKQVVLIFLLCILPLHASLAAVLEYCGHESAQSMAAHPGHHEHESEFLSENIPDPVLQAELDCAQHCVPGLITTPMQTCTASPGICYSPDPSSDFLSAVLAPGERPPLSPRA